jgi:hypothetical protein
VPGGEEFINDVSADVRHAATSVTSPTETLIQKIRRHPDPGSINRS